ncbi:MAG: hypothetical protein GY714_13170 [Desulfobacterales bacterium]|nr:hypothetical protein [Desulfobacterales bacterium]
MEIKTKDYTRTVVLEDSSKAQSFNFEKKIKVEKIRFSIVSVYKGSSFNSTCLSKVVFFLNENKVSIGLIPKYKLCSIEKRMDHTFYTSDSFGNFSEISIDNYGEVKTKEWNKGFTSRKGTYIIDMQTLKKRSVIKIGPPEEARILRDLWSAKIVFSYDDKTSYEDYLFEDYLELKLNNSSNNTFEFTK